MFCGEINKFTTTVNCNEILQTFSNNLRWVRNPLKRQMRCDLAKNVENRDQRVKLLMRFVLRMIVCHRQRCKSILVFQIIFKYTQTFGERRVKNTLHCTEHDRKLESFPDLPIRLQFIAVSTAEDFLC